MNHAHCRSWLLGIALLSLLASTQVFAISPSYIMFYGDRLGAPVVLKLDPSTMRTGFLWDALSPRDGTLQRGTIANSLNGRPYLSFAVFWGRWNQPPVAPDAASQHGRLYLPTATKPAAVVVTSPHMDESPAERPSARPIPADLDEHLNALGHQVGFVRGWVLNLEDVATAKRLGVPGL
jgi:hypothetical protein